MESTPYRCVSLFSGIGGLDRGLELAEFLVGERCESWEPAREVLRSHWPSAYIHPDVRVFEPSEEYDLLAGGFPCTDVSHAGRKAGVDGPATRLVQHVFRIARSSRPTWILLENVPNLLRLHRGLGIRTVVDALESLGYRWAYRTVNSRFTGVPQRRPRVLILASASEDPASVLLADDEGPPPAAEPPTAWGFYWTEGRFGVGAVADAVPTLKGGSTLGLPSAPAVWIPSAPPGEKFKVVGVSDGELLQGLPRGWTDAALQTGAVDHRWKLVANAVTVGVARWVGSSIVRYSQGPGLKPAVGTCDEFSRTGPWPPAAAGEAGRAWSCNASAWPRRQPQQPLLSAIAPCATTLSHRAVTGFLDRLDRSGLRLPGHMYFDLEEHQRVTQPVTSIAARKSSTAHRVSPLAYLRLQAEFARRGVVCEYQQRPITDLRIRVDALIRDVRVAIQLRDCFWDSCPLHCDVSSARYARWQTKLHETATRNELLARELDTAGWHHVTIWGHENLTVAVGKVVARLRSDDKDSHKSFGALPGSG